MDCAFVTDQLVAYHLGTVESDHDVDAIEAHLVACSACLRTYLALKRAADRAPSSAPSDRPRAEVKARLRAEIAETFAPRAPAKVPAKVMLLARRIPLYQGVALAALAAAIALVAPSVIERVASSSPSNGPIGSSIDTSRTKAESLHIY